MTWLVFAAGIFVGAPLGMLAIALCQAQREHRELQTVEAALDLALATLADEKTEPALVIHDPELREKFPWA